MPTKKEIIEQLQRGKIPLPPLFLCAREVQPEKGDDCCLDVFIEVSWQDGMGAKFAVEIKPNSTPKAFQNALGLLKSSLLPQGYLPMLIMPFLREQQLLELEKENVSGIDLCGNGVVIVPGRFAVFRSGGRNRFPSSASIKNIYRKNSSLVGRVFLTCSDYGAVQEICAEVNRRNLLVTCGNKRPMSLSTVSKSLKTLEEDLIVERKNAIRLLQADKLLEKLSENYAPPKIRARVRIKVPDANGPILDLLRSQSCALDLPLVATGLSSVAQYAVMQRGDVLSLYCPRVEGLLETLPGSQSDRFPNLELVETEDETVFFDARQERNFWWASPVQVYLELMAGDKRDRETAEQVKALIIKTCQPMQP